jgi:hypothetical protein
VAWHRASRSLGMPLKDSPFGIRFCGSLRVSEGDIKMRYPDEPDEITIQRCPLRGVDPVAPDSHPSTVSDCASDGRGTSWNVDLSPFTGELTAPYRYDRAAKMHSQDLRDARTRANRPEPRKSGRAHRGSLRSSHGSSESGKYRLHQSSFRLMIWPQTKEEQAQRL